MAASGKGTTVMGNSHFQKGDEEKKKALKKDEIRERNDELSKIASPTK